MLLSAVGVAEVAARNGASLRDGIEGIGDAATGCGVAGTDGGTIDVAGVVETEEGSLATTADCTATALFSCSKCSNPLLSFVNIPKPFNLARWCSTSSDITCREKFNNSLAAEAGLIFISDAKKGMSPVSGVEGGPSLKCRTGCLGSSVPVLLFSRAG